MRPQAEPPSSCPAKSAFFFVRAAGAKRFSTQLLSFSTRPLPRRGDAAALADGEPAQLAAHAGLEDVILPARLPDTDTKAGQIPVPTDNIGAVGLERPDTRLSESCGGHRFTLVLSCRYGTIRCGIFPQLWWREGKQVVVSSVWQRRCNVLVCDGNARKAGCGNGRRHAPRHHR